MDFIRHDPGDDISVVLKVRRSVLECVAVLRDRVDDERFVLSELLRRVLEREAVLRYRGDYDLSPAVKFEETHVSRRFWAYAPGLSIYLDIKSMNYRIKLPA